MSRTTVEMHPNQLTALEGERVAIEREQPRFNVTFTDKSTRHQWDCQEMASAFRHGNATVWHRDFITFSQIPARYGISGGTLKLHLRQGRIRAFLIGGSWFTMVAEVERYIRERRPKRGRPPAVNPQRAAIILPPERPAHMPEREWGVLTMRHAGMTLQQIAGDLGVTRERVRQIESVATRRLASGIESKRGRPPKERTDEI
jgi:hypothetical protein